MYAAYFGLQREPFSIAPDPHYLFMSERHREALAHLLYGLGGGGGFVLLTGEIGTGKTTLCRLFLEQIPKDCNVAYIFNPKLSVAELLQTVCDEFHVDVPRRDEGASLKDHVDALNEFLLRTHGAGQNNVLIIDEAQNLAPEVLEQLRLLTNLETRERKLLQIILIGQPELRQMLARPELEQLAQRVIARYHLGALSADETDLYIRHRLDVAGLQRPLPFDAKAMRRIHQLTRGVPRRINLLCDRALLGAFATSSATVDRRIVERAAAEVFDKGEATPAAHRPIAVALGVALVASAGLLIASRLADNEPQKAAPAPVAAVAAPRAITPSSAAAVVPVVAPPAAQLPELLREPDEAWRELAKAWKVDLAAADGSPCDTLARQGLLCFNKTLSLALIRELNRPGIVTLDAQQGTPSYALLTGLTQDTATLRAAGTEQRVTLAALAARWQGEFATLWRAPPGYSAKGAAKPEVADWIAARLGAATGASAPARNGTLDSSLRTQLKAFQLAHGLPGDGQPGPMTFMQLNRAGGADEPRLNAAH